MISAGQRPISYGSILGMYTVWRAYDSSYRLLNCDYCLNEQWVGRRKRYRYPSTRPDWAKHARRWESEKFDTEEEAKAQVRQVIKDAGHRVGPILRDRRKESPTYGTVGFDWERGPDGKLRRVEDPKASRPLFEFAPDPRKS